ncbi:hypothetical protein RRG08_016988 [Elysia crispata]|uniref:Uncharacterized protein n=1 Tax=Elysia crispata TaxID=231223 RepID=A0AAE1CPH9_9GAST|nr:hypothetical protein RRG08_016988 [Elysia crispata]
MACLVTLTVNIHVPKRSEVPLTFIYIKICSKTSDGLMVDASVRPISLTSVMGRGNLLVFKEEAERTRKHGTVFRGKCDAWSQDLLQVIQVTGMFTSREWV